MQLYYLCEQEKTHFRKTKRRMEVCVVNVEASLPQPSFNIFIAQTLEIGKTLGQIG